MKKGRFAVAVAMIAPFFWVIGLSGSPVSASQAGGNTKNYSVNITPSSTGAGEQVTFTVTIVNENQLQTLGSVDLSLAGLDYVLTGVSGFTINPPSAGASATLATGGVSCPPAANVQACVEVRNLSLPAGTGYQASFQVTGYAPCVGNSGSWTIEAKQANDFSGTGNAFELDTTPGTSSISVGTTGSSCGLRFLSGYQPADSQVNTPISNTPFTPPAKGGGPVEVQLLDAGNNPVSTLDQAANTTQISMSLLTGGSPASSGLGGTTSATTYVDTSVTPSVVVASFSNLKVSTVTQYVSGQLVGDQLEANGQATSGNGFPNTATGSGTSSSFDIWQGGSLCNGTCGASANGNGVTSSVTGTSSGTGTLEVSEDIQPQPVCNDSYLHAPAWSTFQSTGTYTPGTYTGPAVYSYNGQPTPGVLQVQITIPNPTGPASQYEICYQESSTSTPFQLYGGGPPTYGTTGDLATCKQTGGTLPCVGSISKDRHGAIVEVLNVPPGDPCTY